MVTGIFAKMQTRFSKLKDLFIVITPVKRNQKSIVLSKKLLETLKQSAFYLQQYSVCLELYFLIETKHCLNCVELAYHIEL